MIARWFLRHQFKEFRRSPAWSRSIALNIFVGLMMFMLILYLLLLGMFIDKILEELYPGRDPAEVFNGLLLYYLGFELIIRFFMQSLPMLHVESYLHLPIKKRSIVHFVVLKSLTAAGNYLSWLVWFPFAFKVIAPAYGAGPAWIWLAGVILLVLNNNFLATYLKRQLVSRPAVTGLGGLLLVLAAMADYTGYASLSALSSRLFGLLIRESYLLLIPAACLVISYALNYRFLRSRMYPDKVRFRKESRIDAIGNIRYLRSMGLTGQLISLELKLIWRHKRIRTIIYMAPIFLGYGLIFYPQPEYAQMNGFLIFVGIFMTGGMMLNYANYCFGYESNYFDAILAKYRDYERYIRVKYIMAVMIATACWVLTIPYVFFGIDILIINTVTFLYNLGFLSFVLFWFSTYTRKRMDLSQGSVFNYQGVGVTHWLSMLPAFLLPVLIYWPFSAMGVPYAGLIVIAALGLGGLLFYRYLLKLLLAQWMKSRYRMAEGFRE
ncbi:MAG: hypothetical protein JW861_12380 [Bacteroidales bacterium]|nr:hypothetical protein [Bacteroidales bacterium]